MSEEGISNMNLIVVSPSWNGYAFEETHDLKHVTHLESYTIDTIDALCRSNLHYADVLYKRESYDL